MQTVCVGLKHAVQLNKTKNLCKKIKMISGIEINIIINFYGYLLIPQTDLNPQYFLV